MVGGFVVRVAMIGRVAKIGRGVCRGDWRYGVGRCDRLGVEHLPGQFGEPSFPLRLLGGVRRDLGRELCFATRGPFAFAFGIVEFGLAL